MNFYLEPTGISVTELNLKAVPGPGNGQDSISNYSKHRGFLHWTSRYLQIPSNIFKHGLLFYRHYTNPLTQLY